MKQRILIFLLASGLLAALIVHWRGTPPVDETPSRYAELTRIMEQAVARPDLAAAAIGFCVIDRKGDAVFEHHARTAFIPASSLKTLTTATALELWGPESSFETQLRSNAAIHDGAIEGDLWMVGGADPMLSLTDLTAMAAELKSKGLLRITGSVVGDGTLLGGTIYDDFWNWGDIGNGYGSGVSGLNLEHNRYTALFDAGGAEGEPAAFLGASPEPPGVKWINEVKTGPASSGDGVVIYGGERTGIIHLRGSVPLGAKSFPVIGAAPDPEMYAAYYLREALVAAGIQVQGTATSATSLKMEAQKREDPGMALLTHRSPPLIEIIKSIHANSDNHETECIFRSLGVRAGKAPDVVIRDHWRGRGLEFEGLRMEDGCGLARADFIRPVDLARLQYLVGSGARGGDYKGSLLSKDNGTLRWKGGAMSGVRTTTGYIIGVSGEEYCFAFMVNHYANADAVSELRDALIAALRGL